jgi:dTDP-3-amino-3,4,6-trideoxy-alpha-D-glucose transaminase
VILANDFKARWRDLASDAIRAFERVGSSGWYILGNEVQGFERELAGYWGCGSAIGVASGMDAIELALRALGCSPGDRVLTTPLSAFATTLAILKIGAIPVFADTGDCGQIDLARCRQALEAARIRYFVPVHLYGLPASPAALSDLRDHFDLRIVEDCAQSIGALHQGRPTGLAGQCAATSFYPTKNLGAMGDGGAVLTSDPDLDARIRVLRDYGQSAKYQHDVVGSNSRLDELQAAYLRDACLPRLERWTARRGAIAARYLQEIRHPEVRLPVPDAESQPCWHLFPVFVPPARRDQFLQHLKDSEVGAGIHYPIAIPDQHALRSVAWEWGAGSDGSVCRRVCAGEVSLPIHPYLSDESVSLVAQAVNRWPEC